MVIHQQEKDDNPRYMEILTEEIRAALSVQNVILHQSRRILDDFSFVEVLSPVIGPATDPSRRREKSVSIDYYGLPYKLMNERTIYKQALIRSFDNIYIISPNVRLEPLSFANSSHHLSEFYKIDLEMREKSIYDVIETTELYLDRLFHNVKLICASELQKVEREFNVPSIPFPKITYTELYDIATLFDESLVYGDEIPWEVGEEISKRAKKPFWVLDYPVSSRDFYYREDPDREGILLSMDLIYPEGFGEASSGGERETDIKKIIKNLKEAGEKITEYNWYLEMMENDGKRSSGLGIGVERLTRYILGIEDINQCTAFPKRPGSFSI